MNEEKNYTEAARIIAQSSKEGLPYVLDLLARDGTIPPEWATSNAPKLVRHLRENAPQDGAPIKPPKSKKTSYVARVDYPTILLLKQLQVQSGLAIATIASQLIQEGLTAMKGVDAE